MTQSTISPRHFTFFIARRYNTSRQSKLDDCAPVAQRLEQQTHNLLVRGSNPCGGTNQLASCLTLTTSGCLCESCSTASAIQKIITGDLKRICARRRGLKVRGRLMLA